MEVRMGHSFPSALIAPALAAVLSAAPAYAGGPPVIQIPVELFIAVPSAPVVYYAPQSAYDVFQYGGHYYTYQNGWYMARNLGRPWVYVSAARVPRPVLLIPAQYYKKVPPGHAKRFDDAGEQRHH